MKQYKTNVRLSRSSKRDLFMACEVAIKTGSSGISVAGQLRPEIELPTEEQDLSPVIGKGAEAASRVPQGLDDAVEAFCRGILDPVEEAGQGVGEMTLEHPRHLDTGRSRHRTAHAYHRLKKRLALVQ
jgi:hypothetical protein